MASLAVGALLSAGGASVAGATGTALFSAGMAGAGVAVTMKSMEDAKDAKISQNNFNGAVAGNQLQKDKRAELDNFERTQSSMRQFYSMMGVNATTGSARLQGMGAKVKAERVFGDFRQQARLARAGLNMSNRHTTSLTRGRQLGVAFDTVSKVYGS